MVAEDFCKAGAALDWAKKRSLYVDSCNWSTSFGVTEAKAELEEIVLYLNDPNRFTMLGGSFLEGCC